MRILITDAIKSVDTLILYYQLIIQLSFDKRIKIKVMSTVSENQIVKIVRLCIWFIALALILYLVSFFINSVAPLNFKGDTFFKTIEEQLLELATIIWTFLKPFLQVIFCILVLDWGLKKMGVQPKIKFNLKEYNLKFPSLLLLIIVLAFAVSIFYEIEQANGLKELALVVIGYYFGTQSDFITSKNDVVKVKEEE